MITFAEESHIKLMNVSILNLEKSITYLKPYKLFCGMSKKFESRRYCVYNKY